MICEKCRKKIVPPNVKRWRRGIGGDHYYEDNKHGYGVVHAAERGWLASTNGKFLVTKTFKEGKTFVENAFRRKKKRAR